MDVLRFDFRGLGGVEGQSGVIQARGGRAQARW